MNQRAAAPHHDIADERVDLHLAGDIDALGGLIEEQHADPPRKPFRQDHLLLIAPGERACLELRAPRTDVDKFHHLGDEAIAGVAVEPADARKRIEIGQQDVVADRLIHDEAERAFARHHADAGTMPMPTAMASAGLAGRRLSPRAGTVVGSPPAPNRPRIIRSAPLPRRPAKPTTSRSRTRTVAAPSGCASSSGSPAGSAATTASCARRPIM